MVQEKERKAEWDAERKHTSGLQKALQMTISFSRGKENYPNLSMK